MAELTDKSVIDDVFSKGSDMGADTPPPAQENVETEAKAATPEAPAETPVNDDGEGQPVQGRDPATGRFVPVTELVAERKKLKAEREAEARLRAEAEANAKAYREQVEVLMRQIQQPQRQPEPQQAQPAPDPYTQPEEYFQYQQQLIRQELINERVNTSELLARNKHGDEIVDKALQAAHQAGIAARFVNARDPFGALLAWHKDVLVRQEVGTDLEAFKARIKEEAKREALAALKAGGVQQLQGQAPTQQRFPTTLADHTATGEQGGHLREEEVVNSVFDRRQRRRA